MKNLKNNNEKRYEFDEPIFFSIGSAQFGMPYGINNKTKKKYPLKK